MVFEGIVVFRNWIVSERFGKRYVLNYIQTGYVSYFVINESCALIFLRNVSRNMVHR